MFMRIGKGKDRRDFRNECWMEGGKNERGGQSRYEKAKEGSEDITEGGLAPRSVSDPSVQGRECGSKNKESGRACYESEEKKSGVRAGLYSILGYAECNTAPCANWLIPSC